jgi:Flp pilus assembly protein TadG
MRREDGAAAVEFAIIVSLLFVVVFGIMEYGVAFFTMQNLRSSVREGARIAAVRGTGTEIQTAIVNGSSGTLPSGYTGYTVSPAACTDANQGTDITVTLTLSQLPSSAKQALSINIPLLPSFNLTPTIKGVFRCE